VEKRKHGTETESPSRGVEPMLTDLKKGLRQPGKKIKQELEGASSVESICIERVYRVAKRKGGRVKKPADVGKGSRAEGKKSRILIEEDEEKRGQGLAKA